MGQPKRKERNLEAAQSSSGDEGADDASVERWEKPAGLSPKGWAVVGGVCFLMQVPLLHYYFIRGAPDAPLTLPYRDDFSDRTTVEKNYFSTGGHWRTVNGEVVSPGVKNNPLWLKAKLPQNAAVEFDVRSDSPEGDVKVEIFGNGVDHASGYVLIHGGWNNSVSIIARLDEHGKNVGQLQADARAIAQERGIPNPDLLNTGVFHPKTRMRVEANPFPVQRGKMYRWRIERRDKVLAWFIDGQPFMQFEDPFPLVGEAHNRFGFSSWEAQLYFDNLSVTAL